MKLVPVPIHTSGFGTFRCLGCGQRHNQSTTQIYADLEGAPFEAYYGRDCLPRKLRPVQITVTRVEGEAKECGKPQTVEAEPDEGIDLYERASWILSGWARTAPKNGGYDKCDFEIVFEDGYLYKGRYNLYHPSVETVNLRNHVYYFQAFYAGLSRPPWMSDEQWDRAVQENEIFRRDCEYFLAHYDVYDATLHTRS